MTEVAEALTPSDARTIVVVWRREIVRVMRSKGRMLASLLTPLVMLVVLGTGLKGIIGNSGGLNFQQFVLPGAVAMGVAMSAFGSAASIVWDREFGFMREMLVAPVRRGALITGKAVGGATVAVAQGVVMFAFAPMLGLHLDLAALAEIVLCLALTAFALGALGIFLASMIEQIQTFQVLMQFLVTPMMFLSGSLFPLSALPSWLLIPAALNPLTYAVDAVRRVVVSAQALGPGGGGSLGGGLAFGSYTMAIWQELAVLIVLTVALLAASLRAFTKSD